MMKQYNCLWFLMLMMVTGASWAYGSGSSSKACAKPEFTHFTPAENTEVAAGSAFLLPRLQTLIPIRSRLQSKGSRLPSASRPELKAVFR